ncbi:dehydrogenase [Paenibacillus baekrokdamisoli]|uniref:Dehydrogenase n=1 Tax=Paenibacillus baekrokdamisoli TaxID=1712516 RepID=A0A3G9J185_9BACL|nr:Gfo/Idh/MocA family oxidoreductase [Paenibacillus baekrokdamisoli]MBB3069479.1 putative dehydrogenase [Paenibacillus baekrokdamisoli]BBH24947.1 dehydrogenase [Paenibacillus baekrokdamisoli]
MLRVGIAGIGWVAEEHINAYRNNPHMQVAAMCGTNMPRLQARAKNLRLDDASLYDDFYKMVENPDIDIISICTPHHLHEEQAIAAAKAGKHILLEKPIALSEQGLFKVKEAVLASGVKSVTGFVLRWNPYVQMVERLMNNDLIGRPFLAEVTYYQGLGDWYRGFDWIRRKEFGGSVLLAAGCHAVDVLLLAVGALPTEVSAYAVKTDCGLEYPSTVAAIVKFDNGAIGRVTCSLDSKIPYAFHLHMLGTKGALRDNRLYADLFQGQTDEIVIPTLLPGSADVHHFPFQGEIDHLVDCILHDKESFVSIPKACTSHMICLAADRSVESGRPVGIGLDGLQQ